MSTNFWGTGSDMPKDLWTKCLKCSEILYARELEKNLKVCMKCGYHFRLTASERLAITADQGSFFGYNENLQPANPLNFPGYNEKLKNLQEATGLADAVVTGECKIVGYKVVIGITDSNFMMGSMGSVVGEKVTRAMERAIEADLPVLMVSGSGGGARMQEGVLSLMQMAKTAAVVSKLNKANLLYVNLLTDPSMAGVLASFASLGDIIIAEPGALIGFTGPRVLEQVLKVKLPEGFQSAEFQLEHGMIDMVVPRREVKPTLERILRLYYISRRNKQK